MVRNFSWIVALVVASCLLGSAPEAKAQGFGFCQPDISVEWDCNRATIESDRSIWRVVFVRNDRVRVRRGGFFRRQMRIGANGLTSVFVLSGCNIFNGSLLGERFDRPTDLVCPYDPDSDGDGTPDTLDGCPEDPDKTNPGECGCGVAESPTCGVDACPDDPDKTDPGLCGCGVEDTDSDTDGTPDCDDLCPEDPAKTASGECGCGETDADSDADGTSDCNDDCPADADKIDPGACGCGIADSDSDGDATPDCNDGCPVDPGKVMVGQCGCGVADDDGDSDGVVDCNDGCPADANKDDPGECGCGELDGDADADGTADCNDGCPADTDKIDPGACGCGVADSDGDGDTTPDCNDGCPGDPGKIAAGVCGCGVADSDTDGDATPDCNDGCPADSGKIAAGVCGCGVADTDTDGDATPDCNDGCPADAGKIAAGACGCGVADTDTDGDATADCNDGCPDDADKVAAGACGCGVAETPSCGDGCPDDPDKTTPGICGCGTPDTDTDADGTPDCNDGCPDDANKVAAGTCGCGVADTDTDTDGTADCNDSCPSDPDKVSPDTCGCGVADTDTDTDGIADCDDGCPTDPGKIAAGECGCGVDDLDTDGDATADCNDGCPDDPNKSAAGACGCGVAETPNCGDACPDDPDKTAPGLCGCGTPDTDTDGDSAPDCNDGCPNDANKTAAGVCGCGVADTDSDGDLTADCSDGCPDDANKTAGGVCGCGVADTDTDGDLTADCEDACPSDANKTEPGACGCGVVDVAGCADACPDDPDKNAPGICGCGVADTDTDGDATADCDDGCPLDATKNDPGVCGCDLADTDTDGDGALDCVDGCPDDPNRATPSTCGCGEPDVDTDGDSVVDCDDACPTDPSKTQLLTCGCGVSEVDSDGDNVPDCIDGCPDDVDKSNPGACGCSVADGPNGSCAGCPVGQSADTATGECLDPGPDANVYRFDPPVVTEARLLDLAATLGLSGPVTTDSSGVHMLGTSFGPAGPFQMFAEPMEFVSLGRLGFSERPQCFDFIDNNGDGNIDDDDPNCTSRADMSEELPGEQLPFTGPRLFGSQTAAGELTITGIDMPAFTDILTDGGKVTAIAELASPGFGFVAPDTGAFEMTLPLRATVTCDGPGCFEGTCELDFGDVFFDNTDQFTGTPYLAGTGQVGLDGDAPDARIVSCTDEQPSTVNALLRLPPSFVSWDISARFDPPLGQALDALSINSKGHVFYTTEAGRAELARTLVDDATAETIATDLLTDLGLLPPNPVVTVIRLEGANGTDMETEVIFMPRLEVISDPVAPVLAPIKHGGVRVRLGDNGELLGFHSKFVPVTLFGTTRLKDPFVAFEQGSAPGLIQLFDADGSLRVNFKPVYTAATQGANATFLDPLFEVTGIDEPERELAVVAASSFTPKPILFGPRPGSVVDGSSPIPISVDVVGGTPPFDVVVTSGSDGVVGAGQEVEVSLSDGTQTVTVEVTDDNGSKVQTTTEFEVINSPEPPPFDPDAIPVDGELTQRATDGSFFSMSARKDRVGPNVSMSTSNGLGVANVSFGQWRYRMKVLYKGQEFTLQSGKCRDLSKEGRTACDFPSGEGWVTVDSVTPSTYGTGSRVVTSNVTFRNVPGDLSMTFEYHVGGLMYAGPTLGVGGALGTAVVIPGFPLTPSLGQASPGISPRVKWTYTPPTGGFELSVCNGLNDIKREANELEGDPDEVGFLDVPQSMLDEDCGPNGAGGSFSIVEIEVEMFTLVVPTMGPHATTLVRDGASPGLFLRAFDGTMDFSKQPTTLLDAALVAVSPLLARRNHMFTELNPMGGERTALTARVANNSSQFDNFHAKGMPSIRKMTYPGCNSPFLLERPKDWRPCMHMHQRWFTDERYDLGQEVNWHVGRNNFQADPAERPEKFIDGQGFNLGPGGSLSAVWIQSKGKSSECFPAGGLDNSGRPCVMFKAPLFGTH